MIVSFSALLSVQLWICFSVWVTLYICLCLISKWNTPQLNYMFLIYHIYLHTGHGVPYPSPQPVWHLKNERLHYYKQSKLLQLSCPESGCHLLCVYWSCGSSVGIVTILQTGQWRNCGLLPGRGQWFSSDVFTVTLGNT